MLSTSSTDEDITSGKMIAWGEGSRMETREATAVYVFRECEKEIRDARDNEQIEGRMELYGRKNNAENNGAGEAGGGQGVSAE